MYLSIYAHDPPFFDYNTYTIIVKFILTIRSQNSDDLIDLLSTLPVSCHPFFIEILESNLFGNPIAYTKRLQLYVHEIDLNIINSHAAIGSKSVVEILSQIRLNGLITNRCNNKGRYTFSQLITQWNGISSKFFYRNYSNPEILLIEFNKIKDYLLFIEETPCRKIEYIILNYNKLIEDKDNNNSTPIDLLCVPFINTLFTFINKSNKYPIDIFIENFNNQKSFNKPVLRFLWKISKIYISNDDNLPNKLVSKIIIK